MKKKIFKIIIETLSAFWRATVRTAWGIAGIYLLAGLIKGMDVDASNITGLLSMMITLIRFWAVFWTAFFMKDLYYNLRGELDN